MPWKLKVRYSWSTGFWYERAENRLWFFDKGASRWDFV